MALYKLVFNFNLTREAKFRYCYNKYLLEQSTQIHHAAVYPS